MDNSMKNSHQYIFIFTFCILTIGVGKHSTMLCAQTTDSLKEEIAKINALLKSAQKESIATHGWMIALKEYGEAYRLAQENNYLSGQAEALRGIAKIESSFGSRNEEALNYMMQELKIRALLDAPFETAQSYVLIGDIFENKLFTPQNALGYYQQALYLQEKFNETPQKRLETLDKIIGVYRYLNQTDALLTSEIKKLELLQALNSSKEILAEATLSISKTFLAHNKLQEALDYAIDAHQYLPNSEATRHLTTLQQRWQTQQNAPESYNFYTWWAIIIFSVLMSFIAIRQKIISLRKVSR